MYHEIRARGKMWMRDWRGKGRGEGRETSLFDISYIFWGDGKENVGFPIMSTHYHGILMTLKILQPNV